MSEIKSKSYTLRTEDGSWLAQIVLTSDGMFASITNYGNLSRRWHHTGTQDFRGYVIKLNVEYFAEKMYQSSTYILYTEDNNYILHSKKFKQACIMFAQKILPPLQKLLKQDLIDNPDF